MWGDNVKWNEIKLGAGGGAGHSLAPFGPGVPVGFSETWIHWNEWDSLKPGKDEAMWVLKIPGFC